MPKFTAIVLSFSVLDNKNPDNFIMSSMLKLTHQDGAKLVTQPVVGYIFNQPTAEEHLEQGYAKGVTIECQFDGVCEFAVGTDRILPAIGDRPALAIHRPLSKVTHVTVRNPKRPMDLVAEAADAQAATLPTPKAVDLARETNARETSTLAKALNFLNLTRR